MKRVIVLGSGLAAIYFSLQLSEDIEVIMVTGDGPLASNSQLAKGGIAVSLNPADQEAHIADTLIAGCGLCDESIVREVILSGQSLLKDLQNRGLHFDEIPSREGGHSQARIQHIADQTGKFILNKLWADLTQRKRLHVLNHHVAIKLLKEDSTCVGTEVVDTETGIGTNFYANAVILATGGCGNLFLEHTNGIGANGEGSGLAIQAGLELREMEFIQFHPTKLYSEEHSLNVLVTEAFRGAGAVLKNEEGIEFMNQLHPMGSLAPRDTVSIGIFEQMKQSHQPSVWLDYAHLDEHQLASKFPYLFSEIANLGYLKQRRIPVTPAAHYQCGGVPVNADSETKMSALYAVGEVARTGLHGANRLASNSLLELLHFGSKLANLLNDKLEPSSSFSSASGRLDPIVTAAHRQQMLTLKTLMWEHLGIIRDPEAMNSVLFQLKEQVAQLEANHPTSLFDVRLLNRLRTALAFAAAACYRKESLGCHKLA